VPVRDVVAWEEGLLQFLRNQKSDLLDDMTRNDRKVSGDLEDAIKAALDAYNKTRA
jgi:F-type H+-transporting ATPase subunit alpha